MKAFVVEQKVTLIANQYRIFKADESGQKGEQIAFVHQKRLALKEQIQFFADDTKQQLIFTVKARSTLDIAGRYDVQDVDGKLLGVLGKAFKASLWRSTWQIFKPNDELQPFAIAAERSAFLAIFRRTWEFLPYIGDFPFFIKYHFDFKRPDGLDVIGTYDKTTLLHDHYLLRAEQELADNIDERVLMAIGVLMDALQSR
jgi:hypothetical protein